MALFISVKKDGDELVIDKAEWEDGDQDGGFAGTRIHIGTLDKMTAAEQIEFYMMCEHDMVASWMWTDQWQHGEHFLLGQFVYTNEQHKSHKEVKYSNAHELDL